MAENVGYATLNIIPSAKGFGKALKGGIDPALSASGKAGGKTLGNTLKSAAAPLFALAGTVAMGAFVKNAIAQAGALEQSIGAINTIFKGSATQMHEWSIGAATSTGLARNEYNELATLIGSQLKNAGTAMDELGPKTNDLITLGADLSSMFGGTSREAVEALSSALKGERDPIEKYGVSLKQASIDAKAAELGFEKVGGALSSEANAAATLALIMEQTTDAHGNFAKESTTYEGVMQRLGASWANVSTTIGGAFLPFATAAGSVLLSMMPAIQGVADHFASFGENMKYAFEEAGGGLPGVAAMFKTIFSDIAAWFTGGGLSELIAGYQGLQMGLLNAITSALPTIGATITSMLPTILQGVTNLVTQAATVFLPALIAQVTNIISTLVALLPGLIETLSQALLTALPVLIEAGIMLFTSLVTSLGTVLPVLLGNVTAALVSVAGMLLEYLPQLLETGIELFMALVQAVLDVLPDILNTLLVDVLPNVLSTVLGMLPQLLTAATELFFALVTAILDVLPDILKTLLVDVLPNVLSTVLGMLPQLLKAAIELFFALVEGILTVLPDIVETLLVDVLPTLLTTLVKMLPRLIGGAIELFAALVSGLLKNLPELVNTIIFDVIPAVLGALGDAVPDLLQAGVDLLNGLVDGLWSMAGSVGDALLDIIGGAVDGFLGFLGIHSPSRLFRSFGVNVGEGLALGFGDQEGNVAKSALGLANAAADAVDGMALHLGTDVSGDVPEGGIYGHLQDATATSSGSSLHYTQIGGQGLTAEQELIRAARRLQHTP
ncbi:tape measure protein [Microbacterium phage Barnstormer]|uniref:Tape measure protein n=1 Tax=Microbacterium phage Barnstormer TaxID=3028491 RepID=A0AAF0CL87_9CAUD|nr:tape measure protein [Microbacterium phage Barnstormer]WDS52120.1 tape measure protein [Microbacterium phage UtzChips]